jgi:hypothetical protein
MKKEIQKESEKQTIFEQIKGEKSKAMKMLDKAKIIEAERLKCGYKYITSADGKSSTLKKI